MTIRSLKFVPALLAGAVAGANLATVTDLRAQVITAAEAAVQTPQAASDSCLSAPKGATPAGSHWYYRLDRVTKRQCWYLREENDAAEDKFARAAPPVSAPAAPPATVTATDEPAPSQRTITRKAIANARAEWVSQQPRTEAAPPAPAERTAALEAPAQVVTNGPRIAMPNVLTPEPLASMRWNDSTPARTPVKPAEFQIAAAQPSVAQPSVAQPLAAAPPPAAAPSAPAEEIRQPVAEPAAPIVTDAAMAKPTASLQKLLMVMAAALALAGITVSATVRIGSMRARRAMRRKRHEMWDSANTKTRRRVPQSQPQPTFRDADAPQLRRAAAAQPGPRTAQERTTRPPRERPRAAQERPYAPQERRHPPQDRVPQDREREQQMAEMLSRLARSAQN